MDVDIPFDRRIKEKLGENNMHSHSNLWSAPKLTNERPVLTRGDQSEAWPGWGQYNVQCVLLSQMSSSCEGRTVRRNMAHVGRSQTSAFVYQVTSIISILPASQNFMFQLSSKLISPWIKICQIQSLRPTLSIHLKLNLSSDHTWGCCV